MSYFACQSQVVKDEVYRYNLKYAHMTSTMQDIYFPSHAQLSLYSIFPREKCQALHGVQKLCSVYINRDVETNINKVSPC